MRKSRKANKRIGRVRIEITASGSDDILVTVARSCDNPQVLKLVDEILGEIVRRKSDAVIQNIESEAIRSRRGGPVGMPDDRKIEIVRGWLGQEGRVTQQVYAQSQGIATSTLRRWVHQLRQAGKL